VRAGLVAGQQRGLLVALSCAVEVAEQGVAVAEFLEDLVVLVHAFFDDEAVGIQFHFHSFDESIVLA
jgi:hypothetical protein